MQYSKYQKDIFEHVQNGSGNAIIKAVAGSGKTTTATDSIEFMKGKVLSLAFNKKIAVELTNKIDQRGFVHAKAGTFHSVGKNALYTAKGFHKVSNSKVWFIVCGYCDHDDQLKFAKNFITKLVGFAKDYAIGVKGLADIDDDEAWNKIIETQDISLGEVEVSLVEAIDIAKKVLRDSNRDVKCIDFGDMIYLPLIHDINFETYDWLIVDEAQDTNVSRKLLIGKLLGLNGRLLAIGDPNQAIYGFTGAENNSMELIRDMFNCSELPLSVCYRCGKSIVEAAKRLQPQIEAFDGSSEGSIKTISYDKLVDSLETLNLSGKDGIICRNNAPNVALAFALIRQGIGCYIEGRDIGENLLTLCNKWKVSDLDTFTNNLVEFFNREFDKKNNKAKLQLLEDKMDSMIILIERCQNLGMKTVDALRKLIESMFKDSGGKDTADIVTLSSIHKAKGLEFDRCFILGNSQFIPSRYAVTLEQKEQEFNLEYVAITRAKHELINVVDVPSRRNQ